MQPKRKQTATQIVLKQQREEKTSNIHKSSNDVSKYRTSLRDFDIHSTELIDDDDIDQDDVNGVIGMSRVNVSELIQAKVPNFKVVISRGNLAFKDGVDKLTEDFNRNNEEKRVTFK